MTQYAFFNSADPAPQIVGGWFDTGVINYPNLPSSDNLLEVTSDQWNARMSNHWCVSNGTLIAYTYPSPTLAQQAGTMLQNGYTITITGSSQLAATVFPIDATTQKKLSAVITVINATGAFPGGATQYPMKDMTGNWHTFSISEYTAIAGAIATYVASLDLIIDGNPLNVTTLPSATLTLTLT